MPILLLIFFSWVSLPVSASVTGAGKVACSDLVAQAAENEPEVYFSWKQFDEQWQQNMLYGFEFATSMGAGGLRNALKPFYYNAFQSGDRRLAALQKVGIDFSLGDDAVFEMHLSPLQQIVQTLRDRRQSWVMTGLLAKEDSLDPGVMVQDEMGNYFVLPYGQERERVRHVDVSNRPDLLGRMIEEGVFAILSNARSHHDLFHMVGVFESAEYMRGLRRLGIQYRQKNNPLPIRDRYIRYFFVYEATDLLPKELRRELERLASFPFVVTGDSPQVDQVAAFLETLPADEVQREAHQIAAFARQKLRSWGASMEIGVYYTNIELRDSFALLQKDLNRYLEKPLPDGAGPGVRLCKSLARLETALWYSTFVTLEDVFAELGNPFPSPQGPFYRMMVGSGLSASLAREKSSSTLLGLSLQSLLKPEHELLFGKQFQAVSLSKSPK